MRIHSSAYVWVCKHIKKMPMGDAQKRIPSLSGWVRTIKGMLHQYCTACDAGKCCCQTQNIIRLLRIERSEVLAMSVESSDGISLSEDRDSSAHTYGSSQMRETRERLRADFN